MWGWKTFGFAHTNQLRYVKCSSNEPFCAHDLLCLCSTLSPFTLGYAFDSG